MEPVWIFIAVMAAVVVCTLVGFIAYKVGYANCAKDTNEKEEE